MGPANGRVIATEPDASACRLRVADTNQISRWALAHGSRDRVAMANPQVIATKPDASACRLMVADSNQISRWALAHGSRDRIGPANRD
ncbi:hypothetical protein CA13_15340 [Planctomycetes bacterium CA13]|uniref:Uncharacterized protein n=1 Tax=Novipirellula herctigrandis TaxID=2527986 RepID=A0A5C5YZW7_9BACT|nr:hypothetical protein CA13_15340 [Planctomycetes bacterium CA13]